MGDWNPYLHKRFEKQRTQPVKDLIHSIELEQVNSVLDIGCGPGNSTEELARRWNNAKIIGIDSSLNMIEQAKVRLPSIRFELIDANEDLSNLGKFDLVFSNAAIQWMPNHRELITKFYELLNNNGVLAIQLPEVSSMAIQRAVEETAMNVKWSHRFNKSSEFNYDKMDYYYSICAELSKEINLWETDYYHIMDNHQNIIDWYKSTGMKPYLEKLECEEDRLSFEKEVLERITKSYRIQLDGRVLFPFKRLFFIVYKSN